MLQLSERGIMLYVSAQLTSVDNKLQKIDPVSAKWDIPESLIVCLCVPSSLRNTDFGV